jgi:hypothetical protein
VAERGGFDLLPEFGYKPVNKYLPPRARRDGPAVPVSAVESDVATGAAIEKLFAWVDRMMSQ